MASDTAALTTNMTTYRTTVLKPIFLSSALSWMLAMPQKTAQKTIGMIIILMRLR